MLTPVVETLLLHADPAAVRQVRQAVRAVCERVGLADDACETAVLLASETATNAIIHGRSEARIRITGQPGRLRFEVADDNSRHPTRPAQDTDALDGRGMAILETLAAAWGVSEDAIGKTVWFEVA